MVDGLLGRSVAERVSAMNHYNVQVMVYKIHRSIPYSATRPKVERGVGARVFPSVHSNIVSMS